MNVYRLHRAARAANDFTGAQLAGGRWNPIGTPMLYTARHLSLACLEVLVHLDKGQMPRDYVWSSTELPSMPGLLVYKNLADVSSCQVAGSAWLRHAEELAVQAPSAVIPEEFNVLLNPNHEEYSDLVWTKPQRFLFDPRLFAVEPETL